MNAAPGKLAGVVLAAGSSTRLGQPKQLVKWHGASLVSRAARLALGICDAGVTVVTGSASDEVVAELAGLELSVSYNENWRTGMASSLRTGIQATSQDADGLLLMLCDQPLLTTDDLVRLVDVWLTQPEHPVAAGYSGVAGVPAIIPAVLLPALSGLEGDSGARAFLRGRDDVQVVDMKAAELDIDSKEDLLKLQAIE